MGAADGATRHRRAQDRPELEAGRLLRPAGAAPMRVGQSCRSSRRNTPMPLNVSLGSPPACSMPCASKAKSPSGWCAGLSTISSAPARPVWQAGRRNRVAPDVATDGDERFAAQQRQRMQHAAASFQRRGAFVDVMDVQAPARTVAERGRKLLGEVRGVDHHLAARRRPRVFPGARRAAACRRRAAAALACDRSAGACVRRVPAAKISARVMAGRPRTDRASPTYALEQRGKWCSSG